MRRFYCLTAAAAVLMLLVASSGLAQGNVATGQLLGTVTDQDGGVLPGTAVTATNTNTGLVRRATTGPNGFFRIDLLPSGVYDVRADLTGFQPSVSKGVNITLGTAVRIDFEMQLSKVEEEIVVTAAAPVVETTNPSVTSSVSDEAIANLPLNGRDFTDFIALTPATVASTDEAASGRGGVNIGARAIQNSFNIDGSNSQSSFFGEERGGTRPPFTFSQAAIKEFQVLKSSYNPQFSASGGVINAITKSGTNQFEGEVFTYYQDDGFVGEDAEGFDSNNFERTQYGFALGGPFVRDQVHFFVSYDGQDYTTPYEAEFEDIEEATEGADALFSTVADAIAAWEAITGLDWETETGEINQTNDANVLLFKVDWQVSDRHLVTIRDNWSDQEGENLTSSYSNTGLSNNGLEENSFNSFNANLNSVLSDDMFNELIVQYATEERPRTANNTSLPETGIYSYRATWGQNNFLPNFLDEDRLQIIDNFTYYLGDHTLKAGVNLDMVTFDDGFFRYQGGAYSYDGWVEFFNDEPYSYTQSFSDFNGAVKFDTNYLSLYVQDEWRANPNLTVSYGLRYDLQDHDDPKETNPLFPLTGQIPDDDNNWAPRVGFAWDINGDGKQVLRGGAGYFFDNTPTLLDANAMLANGIRVVRVSERCRYGNCPAYGSGGWDSIGDLYQPSPDIFVYDPDFENPETWRISLGYEREILPDFSVGVDFIYSETENLQRKFDLNLAPDGGTTPDGRPTYERGANFDEFDQIMSFVSDAEAEYTALILRARKRFSNGWMLDASYTWAEAKDNDSNERSVSSSSDYAEDQFNLDGDWGPSNFDIEHKFVASATYELPYGIMLSGILQIRSGFPYTAFDGNDVNGDGYRNDRALLEVSDGVYVHYARNTENQPWQRKLDLRLSKTFSIADYELELIADIFNVTDAENWYTTSTRLTRDGEIYYDDFGEDDEPGDPRSYQLGLRFRF